MIIDLKPAFPLIEYNYICNKCLLRLTTKNLSAIGQTEGEIKFCPRCGEPASGKPARTGYGYDERR